MAYIVNTGGRILAASKIMHPKVRGFASAAAAAWAELIGCVDGEGEGDSNGGGTGRNRRDKRDFATWAMMALVALLSPLLLKRLDQLRVDEPFPCPRRSW